VGLAIAQVRPTVLDGCLGPPLEPTEEIDVRTLEDRTRDDQTGSSGVGISEGI
jgi:hypothetical protein